MRHKRASELLLSLFFTGAVFSDMAMGNTGFIRGDADRSGQVDITDPIRIFGFLFFGDLRPPCNDALDSNDSGKIDLADGIYLLNFLFRGATPPPAPFPRSGDDLTADSLDCGEGAEWLSRWNRIALDASGLDHTPVHPPENRVFGEQLGPCRASRAMAIVHIAMFESVNAISGGFKSYLGLSPVPGGTSMKAAVVRAAHDTLVQLFPSQVPTFDERLSEDLAAIPEGAAKSDGVALGAEVARRVLQLRSSDGSQHKEPVLGLEYVPGPDPGIWRKDPMSEIRIAMGARWAEVAPFAMSSASQFRAPVPPSISSEAYAVAHDEVKRLGGDGVNTPTERTAEQTIIGLYWAYDGTPSLCAPPRLYNQIAVHIARQMGTDIVPMARLLALVNVAMADAAIAVWDSKYHYKYWRPVTGIREADAGTGPTGGGDGNPATVADPAYRPLGAPASNSNDPNFTPPFPAYPSGHAGFGGAVFQTLRNFYGTDGIAFSFISDEYNGLTRDRAGETRPLLSRHFSSLSEAEEENGQSRIYLGIHWAFDKTEGIVQGWRVANHVFQNVFTPNP